VIRGKIFAGILAILTLYSWTQNPLAASQIVCADDLAPQGMAITATGTSPNCSGSCRAREMNPVCGPLMKICADQPVPTGYVLDSVTSMPACVCLGVEDNAYVIRYVGADSENVSSQETDPYSSDQLDPSRMDQDQKSDDAFTDPASQRPDYVPPKERYPYGDPPFGNVLCASVPSQFYGNPQSGSPLTRDSGFPSSASPPLENGNFSAPSWNSVPPSPSWVSPDQENSPFRVGQ
jgi:hypothetical protein